MACGSDTFPEALSELLIRLKSVPVAKLDVVLSDPCRATLTVIGAALNVAVALIELVKD